MSDDDCLVVLDRAPAERVRALPNLDRRPRILVLSSTFPRWSGDTEPRFVLDLCRHLSHYADVRVLAPHASGAALDEFIDDVRVIRYRYFVPALQSLTYRGGIIARLREKPWRVLQVPFLLIALWWKSRRLVRAWKPDLLHAHWIIPQGLVGCMIGHNRIPVLCTSHGGDLHGLQSAVFRSLKGWVLKRCRLVTVVSRSMVNDISALAPETPVEVIPMGTDLDTLFVPPRNPTDRKRNELLFVGRLVERKGLRDLLQAVALLSPERPDLNLRIAGDGPLMNDLKNQVSQLGLGGHVFFHGGIRHEDLPRLYQKATIAVFPFVQEGFGLVITEAMGCKCPVIASDIPAVRESIEHDVTGYLSPPENPAALANSIRHCLGDDSLRERLSTAALEMAQQRFDWPALAEQYWRAIDARLPANSAAGHVDVDRRHR